MVAIALFVVVALIVVAIQLVVVVVICGCIEWQPNDMNEMMI